MRSLAALSLLVALVGGGAEAADYKAPRTRYGVPDLSGLWTNSSLTFLERPPFFKNLVATEAEAKMMMDQFRKFTGGLLSNDPIDPNLPAPPVVKSAPNSDFLEMDLNLGRVHGEMRSSWIVEPADGKLPFTDAGRKAADAAEKSKGYDGPEARPLEERCLTAIGNPEGPPMMNTGFNANYQIVQSKDHVAIEVEMNHDVRIVRLNDRKHIAASITPWMGDSVGWWEGDTLVVETTNHIPGVGVGSLMGGFVWSPQSKLTERFTRIAPNEILYEFKVEDPAYFKQPWRGEMPMRAAKGPIYEYACHEGNYSLANALTGAREMAKRAAAEPPKGAEPAKAAATAAAPAAAVSK